MKGLLIKDFSYLKQNKFLYIFLIIFGFSFSLFYDNPSFVLGYYSVFSGILVLGTISYDDYNHGLSFILTLPVTKKQYIQEKYVLSYLLGIVLIFMATILAAISCFQAQKNFHFMNTEAILGCLFVLLFAFLLSSLLIPVQIKFGSHRGQYAMLVVFGSIALSCIIAYFLAKFLGFDLELLLDQLFSHKTSLLLIGFTLIVLLINWLSYKISLSILDKKEF